MNTERLGFVLAVLLTDSVDDKLSLSEHISIRSACERIVAKADLEDLKTIFYANPKLALAAVEKFDNINEFFND